MSDDLQKLLKFLEVERVDKYLFIGKSPKRPRRVFGGQVLAQALNSAIRTVGEERSPHSMHAYFLRPGNPEKQIVYEVDPIRDGGTFTTRRVVAKQDGIAIFNTSVSFQTEEEGLEHQFEPVDATPPEELETDFDYWQQLAKDHPGKIEAPSTHPIERRPVNRRDFLNPDQREPHQQLWVRALGDLSDDPRLHLTVLAYISDFGLLGSALLPHPYVGMSDALQSASLDHAIWFHRAFRADEYLLYQMDSPTAGGGRGFARGSFWTRDGRLVASTAQEALIRVRKQPNEKKG